MDWLDRQQEEEERFRNLHAEEPAPYPPPPVQHNVTIIGVIRSIGGWYKAGFDENTKTIIPLERIGWARNKSVKTASTFGLMKLVYFVLNENQSSISTILLFAKTAFRETGNRSAICATVYVKTKEVPLHNARDLVSTETRWINEQKTVIRGQ